MRMKALAVSCLLLVLAMESAPAEPLETRIVTARGGLNVRQEPTVQSQRVYTLDETAVVVVREWQDGWALVCSNYPPFLPIGWACAEYLK